MEKKNERQKLKPSEVDFSVDFYGEKVKNAKLPNDTQYNFLLDRNQKYMENIALRFDKQDITYEEMHTRIDEYARALYKRGIKEDDVVAVSVANTPEAVYIEYALKKLGAVVASISPINNKYKMVQDLEIVKPKMFIGIQDAYGTFKKASTGLNIDYITFPAVSSMDSKLLKTMYGAIQLVKGNKSFSKNNNLKNVIDNGKDYNNTIFSSYKPNTMSDIMFTGGSSGLHKGVKLDNNGLNCVVKSLDYVLPLEPGEKFMGNLPQFIAFGKMALHYALCKNLEVDLTLKAMPQDFKNELYRIKPAGVFAGPVQWEAYVNDIFKELAKNEGKIDFSLSNNQDYKEYLNYLKQILDNSDLTKLRSPWLKTGVTGGEQLKMFTELTTNMLFENLGVDDRLYNGLGMTEMWAPVSVNRGKKDTPGTIGPLMPFNKMMVVDPNTFEELDFNQTGLLCLNGPGMLLGYYNNEDEEKKAFLQKNNEKWLITGDIVKILPNGEIKYVDRLKRCFVCGVENIYPQQIENLLSGISEINEAIVTKIQDNDLQYVPKYHISLRTNNCDIKELQNKIDKLISSTLGDGNVARFYEFYDKPLPRTANAKLDPKPLQQKDNELASTYIRRR